MITGMVNEVCVGDVVRFENDWGWCEYEVNTDHLGLLRGGQHDKPDTFGFNASVFTLLLEWDKETYHNFLRQTYGYNPHMGDWPPYRNGDMVAAKNTINALYSELGGEAVSKQPKEQVVVHFAETNDGAACGNKSLTTTHDVTRVTCKNCQRTKAFTLARDGGLERVVQLLAKSAQLYTEPAKHCRFFLSDGKTIKLDKLPSGNPCHGDMGRRGLEYVVTLRQKHPVLEDTTAYEQWLLEESPYSSIFMHVDDNGFICDMKKPGNLVSGGHIAMRYLWDQSMVAYLPIWYALIDAGFSKHSAFLFMHMYDSYQPNEIAFRPAPHWHDAVNMYVEEDYILNFLAGAAVISTPPIFETGGWSNVMATWGELFDDEDDYDEEDICYPIHEAIFQLPPVQKKDSMGINRMVYTLPYDEFKEYAKEIYKKACEAMPFLGDN